MTSPARRLPLLTLALALAGCGGDPTGTVSGKVTLDGAPVTGGAVSFMVAGVAYTSTIASDGAYTVGPVPVGEATVLVSDPPDEKAQAQPDKEALDRIRLSKAPPPKPKPKPPTVPLSYSDPAQTTVKTTVKSGNQTFDIALKR